MLQAFTYYRSADNRRAFLLAEVWRRIPGQPAHFTEPETVLLVEWGTGERKRIALDIFKDQVQRGNLIQFTPRYLNPEK